MYWIKDLVERMTLPPTMKRRPIAKLVLLALADHCDDAGRNAWPAIATLAARAETCRRVAIHVLHDLRKRRLIKVQSHSGWVNGRQRPTTYAVTLNGAVAKEAARRAKQNEVHGMHPISNRGARSGARKPVNGVHAAAHDPVQIPLYRSKSARGARVRSLAEEKIRTAATQVLTTGTHSALDAFEQAVKATCPTDDPALVEAIALKVWCARSTPGYWEGHR